MASVLQGVKVVDQGTFITGPAAGMLLGDLGADVIKVEQPGSGDPFRAFKGGLYSPHFQACNRNKRSVTLDTKLPADLEKFDALIRDADVYIQNFRPGVAERLNAGAERLQAINPRLIYCSISGFGPTGPSAQRPAYDGVAQAASGLLSLLITPENPRVVGPALADSLTAFYATYGILGALYERERTAHGRKVELSMLEAMTHFNLDAFTHFYQAGEIVGPYTRPSVSQTYALQCADGKWIALHMSSPEKFWVGLANVIERPTLLQDPRFDSREGRIANQAILADVLADVFVRFDRAEWCTRLEKADVPHSPMYDASDALEDPQAKHLELLIKAQHKTMGEFRTVRCPVSFDGERSTHVRPPPVLGEHNTEILEWP
ncbi:CaiB/BaiF CoA transferase family protein [Paraburkholderia aromaticivorans]|uniref:CaiB/BaiF CoA transferase family protein n=1 Tax=Paraburkholderia aromaticivorans TaxID=2026199 RepID=UPI0014561D03|nr:CoA transferase [Paraburkholderia aromaticivorans]